MKIAVYGATGMVGSRIVAEALRRGHEVTAVSRRGSGIDGAERLSADALEAAQTGPVADQHDVIVSALGPDRTAEDGGRFHRSIENLLGTAGAARLVIVGGAGSLVVDGTPLGDLPDFPEAYRAEARAHQEVLGALRETEGGAEWTYLSPAPLIQPGERTGSYRLGADSPVGDRISAEDYAVALLDEVERPAHRRTRFTVAN